jgi:hypothetical protein
VKSVALVLVMVCSSFAIGCGSGTSAQTISPPPGAEKRGPVAAPSPEVSITKLETPEDRVVFLHQLGKDSTFEPSKHKEFLEKYAGDSDPQVAAAAKELLDKAN